MDTARSGHMRRLAPQPVVATGASMCGLLAAAVSWLQMANGSGGGVSLASLALAVGLGSAVVAAYQFPLHIRPRTKVYLASVPYYLLAVLMPLPLAVTVAGAAALIGELSVRAQRGTTSSQIGTEVGRRMVLVFLGAQAAGAAAGQTPALIAAALVLGVGDIVTFPLLLVRVVRAQGTSLLRVMVATAREASLLEGTQYLLGLLSALAAAQHWWAPALLVLPIAAVYRTFKEVHGLHERERVARERIEEAARVRDEFLTAASHDLRTPLTVIQGCAELVQRRLDSDLPLDRAWLSVQMRRLGEGASRMTHTVEDITDVTQLQLGNPLSLRMSIVDMGELAQQVAVSRALRTGAARTIPVVVDAAPSALVQGDRRRLERVVQNVIGNALKYSPQGTPVQVEVRRDDRWVTLCVRDQGVGIPADELPHIFERHYRASTAQGIKGSGIGLAGAKAILEQHGGHIVVESTVGQGTTATVWLPRDGAPRAA